MKRVAVIFLVAAVLLGGALGFLPRLRDARVTLRAVAIRFGFTAGLDAEDVQFQSAGTTLAGTIVFPQGSPRAGVVLIHGSGKATRPLWMAHLFTSEGLSVLTYDKRGTGTSGGEFVGGTSAGRAANLDLLAQDAAAAASAMRQHRRMRGTPVGYLGFSQGGWVGPIAATRRPDVSFMIFFSGPVTTVSEEGHFSDLAENDSAFWRTHTHEEVAQYMKLAPSPADDVDPRTSLASLQLPGFWAFGSQDNVMPVDLSVLRLQELIARGHPQFQYRAYPNHGHELVVFNFSTLSLSDPFKDGVEWIRRTAAGGAGAAPDVALPPR